MKRILFALPMVALVFLVSACSHVTVPRGPITVNTDVVGNMTASKSVSLESGVTDSKPTLIGSQGWHKWYADFSVWTTFISSQLETELKNRGVDVKPTGESAFRIRVEQAGLYWGSFSTRCIVNVRVEKKDGSWSKSYEGNNASPATIYRAIDGAVYKAVVAILQDKDFVDAMSK